MSQFHTIAFSSLIDEGGVLSYIPAIPDPSVRTNGNDIVVPDVVNQLFGATALVGSSGSRARLTSPSLRRVAPWEILPLMPGEIPSNLTAFNMNEDSPFKLDYNEALNAQILADPGAPERHTVIAWLCDGPIKPVSGKILKVRFQATGALVAGQWANWPISFPDLLPAGVYKVVGSTVVVNSSAVARWYPVGGKWRPGFIPANGVGGLRDEAFRNGFLGEWFSFDQVQPPTLDIVGTANVASATYEGVMDLIPV